MELPDQIRQSQEIVYPEAAPPDSDRRKSILGLRVGPARWQAYELAALVTEVHAVLPPRLPEIDEPKLPPIQGVKGVRYAKKLPRVSAIVSS